MSVKNETRGSGSATQHIECQEKFDLLKHTMNMYGTPRNACPPFELNIRVTTEAPIEVFNKDYADVELPSPEECVIYCDIPYDKTYSYVTGGFDYERFYKWCQEKAFEGYQIYVSSYELPEELFILVLEKQRHCKATSGSGKKVVEKIYTVRKSE